MDIFGPPDDCLTGVTVPIKAFLSLVKQVKQWCSIIRSTENITMVLGKYRRNHGKMAGEWHPTRRPRNSHSLRCRGLLEVIEGSFHGNTVSLDELMQSDESSDDSCATQRRCSVKDWGVEFVHIPPALQSYPESQWSTVH